MNQIDTAKLETALNLKNKQKFARLPAPLRMFLLDSKGAIGLLMLLAILLMSLSAPLLSDYDPQRRAGGSHEPPSAEHILGTTRMGKDVFTQLVYGGRTSLLVGFTASLLSVAIAIVIGVSAGYFGGVVDELLTFLTNVMLVIPGLPLIIVMASFFDGGASPFVIGVVFAITGWAWSARVLRTQTLTLKNKEFITAAELIGERKWRIVLIQIFPNMLSLTVGGFVLGTIYAILAEAGLEFIGIGDPSAVTWGTMLYWAQSNQAISFGAWWELVPPAVAIMWTGAALTLINFSVDQITNPQLASQKNQSKIRRFLKGASA
ncbi:ABC transporter permease [Salinibius halmophilus]|uniref:ABC transporter permease n=1 Tax=Salinibius halmophilus TaxID=1853216 RepID=UPI000E670608|nr:ABC transporter permease [Salinibius halmophilus]